MLAWQTDASGDRAAVGWAQFGPISAYPRAQIIRERYPSLPDSPAPWVVTCLQVVAGTPDRDGVAAALLGAVCDELDKRGIIAVESYPEGIAEPWSISPGPASVYEAAGFTRVAVDDRYPAYRRELEGASADVGWADGIGLAEALAPAGARPRDVHQQIPGIHRRSRAGDARLPGIGLGRLRLRQQHPDLRARRRRGECLRLPRLRAGCHPAALLRGQRPLPLGRPIGRSQRHPQDRCVPERLSSPRTNPCTDGCARPRRRCRSRAPGADLLARLRRTGRGPG